MQGGMEKGQVVGFPFSSPLAGEGAQGADEVLFFFTTATDFDCFSVLLP